MFFKALSILFQSSSGVPAEVLSRRQGYREKSLMHHQLFTCWREDVTVDRTQQIKFCKSGTLAHEPLPATDSSKQKNERQSWELHSPFKITPRYPVGISFPYLYIRFAAANTPAILP